MIRIALLVLTILIAEASAGFAQTVYGAGTVSCGEWSRLRSFEGREGNHNREVASSYQARAWIDGFMSGIKVEKNDGPDFLASTPLGAAHYAWVDNYCRENPLDLMVTAAHALVKELRSRAARK
jgi:hypothetical protein